MWWTIFMYGARSETYILGLKCSVPLDLPQKEVVIGLSLWQVRFLLKNTNARPGEHISWTYIRIVRNTVVSPLSGLVFCLYKVASGERLGYDPVVTVLCTGHNLAFSYSAWIYNKKVVSRVADGLKALAKDSVRRRIRVALFIAHFCWVPMVGSAVGFSVANRSSVCIRSPKYGRWL